MTDSAHGAESEIDPEREDQDRRMAELLRQLLLLSHGSTYGYNSSGGGGSDPSGAMVGRVSRIRDLEPVYFQREYDRQTSRRGREDVIADAKRTLDGWRGAGDVKARPSIDEEKVIIDDFAGVAPHLVAQTRNLDVRFVRKVRRAAGRGTEDGLPLAIVVSVDAAARATEARRLRTQGLTMRQIALHLHVNVATISRDLAA